MQVTNSDNIKGTLTFRKNGVNMIAYIALEDGTEDTQTYSKDDTEDYIIEDLKTYHNYTINN